MAKKYKFDKSHYEIIEAYILSGKKGSLSNEDVDYLEILDKMHSMRRKYSKEQILLFFQKVLVEQLQC